MTPMLYVIGAIMGCLFIAFGWGGEGYIHQASLIVGGLYFGHIITEALNHKEET